MKRTRGSRGASKPEEHRPAEWAWLGISLLAILPAVFFAPDAKENFRLPKLLLSETLGLATLWWLAWRLRGAGRIELGAVWRQPAVLAAAPLLLAAALGLATSDHPQHVRQALFSLAIGLACFVGWSLALSESEKRSILKVLLLPAGVLSWIAVAQHFGFLELSPWIRQTLASAGVVAACGVGWALGPGASLRRRPVVVILFAAAGVVSWFALGSRPELFEVFHFRGEVEERITLTSLAGGAFDLSGYLVLPLLIGQAALYRESRRGHRLLLGLLVLSMLYAVALTRTFTAIAALVAASFVLWLVLLPWRRVTALTAVVTIAGAALVAGVSPLRQRLVQKTEGLGSGDLNRVLTGRLDCWRAAWWMFDRHPVAGVGHGVYRAEFGSARLALVGEGVRFYGRQHQPYFSNAHSEYLEVLAEWGLVGLLAVGWAVGLLWRRVLRRRGPPAAQAEGEAEGEERISRALAWAGVTAIALLSIANFPLRIALVAYPYILFFSWIFGASRAPAREGRRTVEGRRLGVVVLVVLSLALYAQIRQAWPRWRASHQLAEVEQRTLMMGTQGLLGLRPMPAEVRRILEGQVDMLRAAAELDPLEVAIPIARGSLYYLLERPEAAIRAYQESLELEARSESYANLGRAYLMAGDRDAARQAFRTALRLNRDIAKRFRPYLRELGMTGRQRGARRPSP